MKRYHLLNYLATALICLCQLARAQDLSRLGLATSEVLISPEQSAELETAINALPPSAREPSAKALQIYVAKGSRATREEWIAGEESVRSVAVQTLVRLAPAEKGTRDAIHDLLSRNLALDDRMAVLMCIGSEQPADPESVNILIKALDDDSPGIRSTAINSLDAMDRNRNPIREKAEPKINQMSASDPDPQTRALAAETLQHLRGFRPPILPPFPH